MEFIKNFFVGVAKFAYDFFIEPIVQLRHIFSMTNTQKALAIIDAAAKVTIMASWFFAVPAILLTLAWVYIATSIVVGVIYLAFSLGSLAALGAFGNFAAKYVDGKPVTVAEAALAESVIIMPNGAKTA
jgi:fatty acid desaturase